MHLCQNFGILGGFEHPNPPTPPRYATVGQARLASQIACGRMILKYDGTRAETRFRLSSKRTIPFKSAGASVQSAAGSRGVRISGSNASNAVPWLCEEYWLTNPFASFPLTSPPVRHRVPSHFNRTVADQNIFRHKRVEVT